MGHINWECTFWACFAVGVVITVALLVNKGMDNEAIQAYIDDGAKFAEAYCAVHEPEQFKSCYEGLTSK